MCVTDPDATTATNARNRRLEPAYKQYAVVDDLRGVVLDVAVTTGEVNEGQVTPGSSQPSSAAASSVTHAVSYTTSLDTDPARSGKQQ
jgi:hypothetical protein